MLQWRYIYLYSPRHKFYNVVAPWTAMGPMEVKRMVELITPLVKGNQQLPEDKRKQIFEEPPHITMDNFFSRDIVMNILGE